MLKPLKIESSTLHIALATYPKGEAIQYIDEVKKSYTNFKQSSNSNYQNRSDDDSSYTPLIYHIFGIYDVAFITVIDSYKFAQKIFLPKDQDFNPNSYQILTGLCPEINKDFDLSKLHQFNKGKMFINICNLKLNNGFIIGSGLNLFELVIKYIDNIIKKIKGIANNANNGLKKVKK